MNGIGYLILAQCMVGINIVACKYLLTSMSALFLLLVRFSLASVVLLPLHWLNHPTQPVLSAFKALSRLDWLHLCAQALTAGVFFNCLMITGLKFTDANVAGIITSALPALITLISYLVLKETLTAKKSLCLFFATLGLIIIAAEKLATVRNSHSFLGDSIVFLVFSLIPIILSLSFIMDVKSISGNKKHSFSNKESFSYNISKNILGYISTQ